MGVGGKELPIADRDAWALFKFEFKGYDRDFRPWLVKVIQEFMQWCEPEVFQTWLNMISSMPMNKEGLLYGFKINGKVFGHVKMCFYDGARLGEWNNYSVLFRDHFSPSEVAKVMLVADAFERFLVEKKIGFELTFKTRR